MNALEMLLTLGKMGYSKADIERMIPQPQPQPQVQPQVQPNDYLSQLLQLYSQGSTQPQPQLPTPQIAQPTNSIEEELRKLTQAVQLNNVQTMSNSRPLPTTTESVLASIINPPVDIPDNTIKGGK